MIWDRIYWPNVILLILVIVFIVIRIRKSIRCKKQKEISARKANQTQAPLAPVSSKIKKSEDKIMNKQFKVKAIAIGFLIFACACTSPIWWGIIGEIGYSMSDFASSVVGAIISIVVTLVVVTGVGAIVAVILKATGYIK